MGSQSESNVVRIPLAPDDPLHSVRKLEDDLGLNGRFFESLLKEDDWSFVVKLHALIEAGVSHVLAEEVDRPELQKVFARLELSGAVTGKLAFAKALDCLDSHDRGFVRVLSEIRNRFVHDVSQVGLSLDDYVASLDKNQLTRLVKAVGPGRDPFPIGDKEVPETDVVRQNPKLCMWIMAMYALALMYQRKVLASLKREALESRRRFYESISSNTLGWLLPEPKDEPKGEPRVQEERDE